MTDLVSVLEAARARIADEKNWTTDLFARDDQGFEAEPDEEGVAVCWCAVGALLAEGAPSVGEAAMMLHSLAASMFSKPNVETVNDDSAYGHPAVLQIYDRAIADARTKSEGEK